METNSKIQRALIFLLIAATLLTGCISQTEEMIEIDRSNFKYNFFHEEDGLFEFEYKNNHEVIRIENIYFLKELKTGEPSFQIFEVTDETEFDQMAYVCDTDGAKTVCYSKSTPDFIVKEISIFPGEEKDKYRFVTRAGALRYMLQLRHPETDFSTFASSCFDDIYYSHPDSGYICYAKENGIVEGIAGMFYPDSGINLWGTLKFLFFIYEEDDYEFDEDKINEDMFEKMTIYHHAYEVIAKSLYEGIIINEKQDQLWPNKVLYKAEFDEIVENFFLWQNEKQLRDYEYSDGFKISNEVYIKGIYTGLTFEKDKLKDFKYDNLTDHIIKETTEGIGIYVEEGPGIYQYLTTLKGTNAKEISSLKVNYNKEKMNVRILVEYKKKNAEHYKLEIKSDQFSYMETAKKSIIEDPNIAPNSLNTNLPYSVAKVKVYMEEDDFDSILENRTLNTRYPAYLKILYPGGDIETHSVLIKIRGNANRGYIKSSYTIESFDDFDNGLDEIKLRSMISDESLIREKLVYTAFSKMGYPEPSFSEALLELNNNSFGFYQITEGIKQDFFDRREINVKNWFYAQNVTSPYLANLTDLGDEDIIEKHFEPKGDRDLDLLIDLIHDIDDNKSSLKDDINLQNVFDFTLFCYVLGLNDSYTHNYYLYIDENTKQWNMFFWDVDAGMEWAPKFTKSGFKEFTQSTGDWYNALIHYVFNNITDAEFNSMLADFKQRWDDNVNMTGLLDYYKAEYREFFEFDNDLWNDRFLERKDKTYNTVLAISTLKTYLKKVESGLKSM